MATRQANKETDIRRRLEGLVSAIRAIEPPPQHLGAEAKWSNWEKVFTIYQPPLDYETRDLTITVGDDVAFAHALARMSGTLKNGKKIGYWVRWTTCLRKLAGSWLIVHDQVSVPVDFQSGERCSISSPDFEIVDFGTLLPSFGCHVPSFT
jgi:ketosteroid isomerase-like protein